MCKYVDNLFTKANRGRLNSTESYWISVLEDAYMEYGHLTDRQLEVLSDISDRASDWWDDGYDDYY